MYELPQSSNLSTSSPRNSSAVFLPHYQQANHDAEKAVRYVGSRPTGNSSFMRADIEEYEAGGDEPMSAEDWNSPSDAANPHNWSMTQRIFQTAVPSAMALCTTFASSAYVPTTFLIEADMGVTREVSIVAFAIFILGLAVGAPLVGPCSELFGRKPVYIITMPITAAFIVGTGFSKDITSLVVTRFFSGCFSAAPLVVAAGTIADIWADHERSLPMALFVLCPFLGPALGPVIGTYVVTWKGWKWVAWVQVFFCVVVLIPAFFMKETSKCQILQKRAQKLNIPEPVVACFSLWVAFNFGLMYAFFAAFEWVFMVYYEFSPTETGLTFLGLGSGVLSGFLLITLLLMVSKKKAAAAKMNGVPLLPEQRLILAMIGGPLIPIALFMFGWTACYRVHWIVPVIAEGLFGCANYLVFISAVSYMIDVYGPVYGASAIGASTLLRYLFGTGFPLFAVQMYEKMHVQWASTLLGVVSVVMMFIPFVLNRAGPWLRSKSRYVKGA